MTELPLVNFLSFQLRSFPAAHRVSYFRISPKWYLWPSFTSGCVGRSLTGLMTALPPSSAPRCHISALLVAGAATFIWGPPKGYHLKEKNFLAWGWTPDIWETQSGTYSGHQELISVFVLKIELLPRVFMFNYMSFLLFLVQWGLKAHHDDFAERPKLPLLTFLKVESIHQGAKIIIIIIKLSWNYETYTRKKLKDYVLKPQDIEYYSL